MRYLTIFQVLELHQSLIEATGGSKGVRDFGALEPAIAQPEMSFGGEDLYPTLIDKASALAYSLCKNHPFVDGNKRLAHAAMEVFLVLNGFEVNASVDEQEKLFLDLARGELGREELTDWLQKKAVPISRAN